MTIIHSLMFEIQSLSVQALMSYNLDLKRPQIILSQVQEFNFL